MKNLKNLVILSLSLAMFNIVLLSGQEKEESAEETTFDFSGTVDTYFRTSFSEVPVAPKTSFANLNGFALGMANFIVSYEGKKSGFVADVVFGPRGSEAIFGSSGNSS